MNTESLKNANIYYTMYIHSCSAWFLTGKQEYTITYNKSDIIKILEHECFEISRKVLRNFKKSALKSQDVCYEISRKVLWNRKMCAMKFQAVMYGSHQSSLADHMMFELIHLCRRQTIWARIAAGIYLRDDATVWTCHKCKYKCICIFLKIMMAKYVKLRVSRL